MSDKVLKGRVFDIQFFSIHDGPGIRTNVFLKGCPLRCKWCHNPEGYVYKQQLSFVPKQCIGCGMCFETCRQNAHTIKDNIHIIDRNVCTVCGTCVNSCYGKALEITGRDMSVDEVVGEVLKDKDYYTNSGGGVTLSGGEPFYQGEYALSFLKACKDQDLHTAVETCGVCDTEILIASNEYVNLYLFDYKETNPVLHKKFTGMDNKIVLKHLDILCSMGCNLILRCPIIPGFNDRDEHFEGIADTSRRYGIPCEILPYHSLGESKKDRFDLATTDYTKPKVPSAETATAWRKKVKEYGGNVIFTE